jgi:hypothetical protein
MLLFHPFSPILVWYHSNCFEVLPKRASKSSLEALGAGDGIRTRDPLLGKQLRYHCATPAWHRQYTQRLGMRQDARRAAINLTICAEADILDR